MKNGTQKSSLENLYGIRDKRNHYHPYKKVVYPPVFIWPVKPLSALAWIVSIPGYFLPWNLFYMVTGLIAWYLFSPQLEDYTYITLNLLIIVYARNSILVMIYYGLFHLKLFLQRTQGITFKFNPRWPDMKSKIFLFGNQTYDNIFLTFISGVSIWTLFEVFILSLAANGYLNLVSPTVQPIYFGAMICLIHLWRDLHFYLIHRLIHWLPLYKIAHYVHHKNTNPGPWSGLAMHPVEHLMYFSCALLFILLPFHPAFVVLTLVHAGLSPAPGHAGFERIVASKGKFGFDLDSYAHYLHHKYFECNYADGILPLDRWFGTFHDGSKTSHKKMQERFRKKRFIKRPETYNTYHKPFIK